MSTFHLNDGATVMLVILVVIIMSSLDRAWHHISDLRDEIGCRENNEDDIYTHIDNIDACVKNNKENLSGLQSDISRLKYLNRRYDKKKT